MNGVAADQIHLANYGAKMKKRIPLILCLIILVPILSAFNLPSGDWGKNYKLSTLDKAIIKDSKGETLGEIEDFVMDPQNGRIVLVVFSDIGVAGMGHKVKIIPYEFLSFDERHKNFILDMKKRDLTSPIEVKNHQGEKLGEIVDFIIDFQGRIPFVILSHRGKMINVPYSALSVEETGLILDASVEKLSSAPTPGSQEDSIDKTKAEEIYRYFGQSPYWTAQ